MWRGATASAGACGNSDGASTKRTACFEQLAPFARSAGLTCAHNAHIFGQFWQKNFLGKVLFLMLRRGTAPLFLALAALSGVSCTRSASRNSHVAPTPVPPSTSRPLASSSEYPDTAEGLQNLMTAMLAATKHGDKESVDALMKKTEFPDYAHYFVSTYSPDAFAAEDWAIVYKRWLSENEDHLRELLEKLAKDEDGKILVRKASDDPTRGKGFEWGMVHYARNRVDVYCVTLIFSPSPDGPTESIGYFVYADGEFRWDSIVPFAAPGTYQSVPSTLNTQQAAGGNSAQYPNSPDGLRGFLNGLWEAEKRGDVPKVDAMIRQTEIPEYRNWFCSVYVPGSGLSWAIPYGNNLAQNEQSFKALWEKLVLDDGKVQVRKVVDKPGGNRDMEWGMIHNSRTPLDIYDAGWKSGTGAPSEWIGYFIYIDGMFRLESTVRRVVVIRAPSSAANL